MTKKNWLLIGSVTALLMIYGVFYTSWFRPKTVQIFHSYREIRVGRHRSHVRATLIFGLNRRLRLSEIEVVNLKAFETNSETLPLWHLQSTSRSVPVKDFVYGQPIRGMKPVVSGTRPQPLATNVLYRLLIKAGGVAGKHDFELK